MGNQNIHEAIEAIMQSLAQQGTSTSRLKNFRNAYNVFGRYLRDNNIIQIDEAICLEYIYFKTGLRFERFECVIAAATPTDSPLGKRLNPARSKVPDDDTIKRLMGMK